MDETIRILLLEDNPSDVELMKRELRVAGIRASLDWTQDRDGFVRALESTPPDLVLADYSLPGFDGLTALSLAKERFAELPVIIVSGAIGEETAIEALTSGATDYVLKHRLGRLGPVVRRALQEAEQRAERRRADEALRRAKDELEERVNERTAQLRRLALELTQAEQRERRRLAEVLHDHLQQLLVGAKFGIALAARQTKDAPLQQSIERVASLLDESLNVSRSLAVELSPPVLHEAGLVAAVHWLAHWMREHHALRIDVQAPQQIAPDPEGVSALLFESIRELLLNVVKHARVDTAQVSIVSTDPGRLEIVVADRGSGFDLARLAGDGAGAGFGLFSIRERLGLIGGRLMIDTAPGEGTRVTLTAPLPQAAATSSPLTRAAAWRGRALADKLSAPVIRVVVADDYTITRQGVCRLLQEEADIEVVGEARDGREAVAMARRLRPDVVIMDVNMPRLDGIAATREIATTMRAVRVIGLSMHQEEEWAKAMLEAGAVAYLHKTGQPADLIASIRAAWSAGRGASKPSPEPGGP